jgi:DNA-binding MarR family transcriptional regulator
MSRSADRPASAAAGGFVLAEFIPYRIVTLGHRISRALSAVYEGEDLTIPEWRVLAVVGQASAVAARDVAALTPMDKMAVSRAVASLVKKDFVERRSDARDRRVQYLRLSDRGRAVFERVAGLAKAFETQLVETLDADELSAFKSALARLESAGGAARR